MRSIVIISTGIFLLLCLFTAGCTQQERDTMGSGEVPMGNPATLYCHSLGYESVIHTDAQGGQCGYCRFPNGTEVDEWELFRSAHPEKPTG
jgi:putative hemolysin